MKRNLKLVTLLGIVAVTAVSCKNSISPLHKTVHHQDDVETRLHLDVMNDDRLDTLIIESLPGSLQKKIRILNGKNLEDIFIIEISSETTENIYIESNSRSASNKGFRILLRNTNLIPDYNYLDLLHENKTWVIKNIGYINTNPDGNLESCIAPYEHSMYEKQIEKNTKLLNIKKIVLRSDSEKFSCH